MVGELVHAWPDDEHAGTDATHEDSGPLAWVETPEGDAVRIPAEDVADIAAGSTVEVTVGAQVDHAAAIDAGLEPARVVLAADVVAAPGTTAARPDAAGLTNQVTVVLVTPQGVARDGATEQQVVAAVDGPVARFWAEQTGDAVRLGVTASRGWTSTVAGCSDPAALWNEVAGTVGFTAGPGRHLLLHVSDAAKDCSYALAEVGAATSTGGRMYVRDSLPSLIAHEFGHNFGLGHSSGHQCDAAMETGICRTASYRDLYDVMGFSWGQLGSLNAAQAARLGMLPALQQQALTSRSSAVSLTLAPVSGTSGTRALRLTDAEGVDYWVEYRTATGRDAWLTAPSNAYRLQSGVLLRRAGEFPDTSVLLDGTPSAAARWDVDLQAALPVGVPVSVAGGAFTLTVDAMAGDGAALTVTPTRAVGPVTPLAEGEAAPDVLAAGPFTVPSGDPAPEAAAASPEGLPGDAAGTLPVTSADATVLDADDRLLLAEPVSAAVVTASSTLWAWPAAVAVLVALAMTGWIFTRKRGLCARD